MFRKRHDKSLGGLGGASKKTKANLKLLEKNPDIQYCWKRDPRLWKETQDLKFEPAPYHGKKGNNVKSKGPENGQDALFNSVSIGDNTNRRIGYDYKTGEFVVFDNTGGKIFHGHVQNWEILEPPLKNALKNRLGFNHDGKIILEKLRSSYAH
jgi:hypothetical protein